MAPDPRDPAQTPLENAAPAASEPPDVASGIPSIVKSVEYSFREMGALRSVRLLARLNQFDGFDCPSCAWPDPEGHRSMAEFCENGAKAVASEATTKLLGPEFFEKWSVSDLGRQPDLWLNEQGRLVHPMILREGASHYTPISWAEAFEIVGNELRGLDSPDEAIFYTSGRASNEAAFLYQLFARMFGTNNLPDCSNMCHESSGFGLRETIGVGKSTVTLEDLEHTDCIFVIGQNPGTNHPRMLSSLQRAVRNGCTIVSVNPLHEVGLKRFKHPQEVLSLLGSGMEIAKLHLPVRVNGDVALLKGIMKIILEADAIDREFIEQHTACFEELAAHIKAVAWTDILAESGISQEQLQEAADIVMRSRNMVICWAMGLTQHRNAVENIREVVNLLLLRGNVGKPNAGVCCVRGHSNVQGDRTMGIWEQMDDGFLDRLGLEFHFEPPRHHGLNTVEAIHAMAARPAKVFIALGGNFLSATPDTAYTAQALRNCRFTVQISTKLNRSHLVTGKQALILPCLGRTDKDGKQFVTTENSMNVVASSRGMLSPASDLLMSEPAIVAGMAAATLGSGSTVEWNVLVSDYNVIREHIGHVVKGCEDYNRRVSQPGGFRLDNPASRRVFNTATGKANFTINPIRPHQLQPGEFLMMSIRSHDQFNTTIYGNDDRYRGIHNGRRVVFLNADDISAGGLRRGQYVDLISRYEGVERVAERFVVVPYEIPRRCAATYFPECNVLIPVDNYAEGSMTPASKSVIIRLRAANN